MCLTLTITNCRSETVLQQGANGRHGTGRQHGQVPLLGGRRSAAADTVAQGRRSHARRQVRVGLRVLLKEYTNSHRPSVSIRIAHRADIMEDDKSLIIKNVVPSDEGIYICEAHNSIGQISAKAQLGVNCKYNPPPNSRPSCVAPALWLSIIESLPKLTSIEMCTPHITYISEYDNGTHSTTPHSRISTWLHARTHAPIAERAHVRSICVSSAPSSSSSSAPRLSGGASGTIVVSPDNQIDSMYCA